VAALPVLLGPEVAEDHRQLRQLEEADRRRPHWEEEEADQVARYRRHQAVVEVELSCRAYPHPEQICRLPRWTCLFRISF